MNKINVAMVGYSSDFDLKLENFHMKGVDIPKLKIKRLDIQKIITDGLNWMDVDRAILKAEGVDSLYREGNKEYLTATNYLLQKLEKFDIIIFNTFNPIHPEIINLKLKNKIKILGFSDDPYSTYVRGIPYLWAFDFAYYISPSYSKSMSFPDLFKSIGFNNYYWLPLINRVNYKKLTLNDIKSRPNVMTYVGAPTGSKLKRIVRLKNIFGDNFNLYGRWRFSGYYGLIKPLLSMERPLFMRVGSISEVEKLKLYYKSAIGLNMHMSDIPMECGNMRTYEAAASGMMLLSDRGGGDLQSQIFSEGDEAVYYDNIEEAISLAQYYFMNQDERSSIAFNAHQKFFDLYAWEVVWLKFLKWVSSH